MSFIVCPSEILCHIISYVYCPRDVAALALSCRAVHTLCNLELQRKKKFHLICIRPDDAAIEEIFQLLMEVLKQPSLGRHVHEIRYYGRAHASGDWRHYGHGQLYPRDLEKSEMELIRAHVQRVGFSSSWEDSILEMLIQKKTGDWEGEHRYVDGLDISRSNSQRGVFIAQALATILISVAPSLMSLAMMLPWATWSSRDGDYYPLEQFLLEANSSSVAKPYLQNLREVYIMTDESGYNEYQETIDDRYYVHTDFLDCFRMFDKLPSIETLSIDGITDDDEDEPNIEEAASKLTKLHINHSALDDIYLARAISACKSLKELQYSIGGRETLSRDKGHLNNKTFSKAILKHKNSLEVLDIDSGKDFYYHNISDIDTGYDNEGGDQLRLYRLVGETEITDFLSSFWDNHGSLKDFSNLKSLSLGIGLLMYLVYGEIGIRDGTESKLIDSIPKNLEYLCVRGYRRAEVPKHDAPIDLLMGAFNSGSLGLKEIRGIKTVIPFTDHYDVCNGRKSDRWCLQSSRYSLQKQS